MLRLLYTKRSAAKPQLHRNVCGSIQPLAYFVNARFFLRTIVTTLCNSGTVAPFSYTSMLWSIGIGFFIFSEVPELIVLLGAALVIAAGLFVIFRERSLGIDRTLEREAETPPAGPAV